jgi:hypothetical protein
VLAARWQSQQVVEERETRQLGMGKMERQHWEVEVMVGCLPAQVGVGKRKRSQEEEEMSLKPVQAQATFVGFARTVVVVTTAYKYTTDYYGVAEGGSTVVTTEVPYVGMLPVSAASSSSSTTARSCYDSG